MFLKSENRTNKLTGMAIVAAFGLTTVATSASDNYTFNGATKPISKFDNTFNDYNGNLSLSSTIYNSFSGDMINNLETENINIIQNRKRIPVNILVTSIKKHISNFELEEIYEEI